MIWRSATGELDQLSREMKGLFDAFAGAGRGRAAGVYPAINVSENDDAILVRAELPGVDPGKLDITVESNTLTIAGARDEKREEQEAGYHRREREWGRFRRSFQMPVRVDGERVDARYENGILTVELPKAAESRPRRIAVQAGA